MRKSRSQVNWSNKLVSMTRRILIFIPHLIKTVPVPIGEGHVHPKNVNSSDTRIKKCVPVLDEITMTRTWEFCFPLGCVQTET